VFSLATVLSDAYANGQQLWSYQMDVSYSVNLPVSVRRSDRQARHAASGTWCVVTPTPYIKLTTEEYQLAEAASARHGNARASWIQGPDPLNRDTIALGIAASRHGEWAGVWPSFIDVDPGRAVLAASRRQGADPGKLARANQQAWQFARWHAITGAYPGKRWTFSNHDGVTRAIAPPNSVPASWSPGSDSESASLNVTERKR